MLADIDHLKLTGFTPNCTTFEHVTYLRHYAIVHHNVHNAFVVSAFYVNTVEEIIEAGSGAGELAGGAVIVIAYIVQDAIEVNDVTILWLLVRRFIHSKTSEI